MKGDGPPTVGEILATRILRGQVFTGIEPPRGAFPHIGGAGRARGLGWPMSFGGKAAHDALQRLAISVDPPRAFVDRDVRAANIRRLRDDAVGECLRIFQLCAAPALGDGGNLRLVLTPCVRWCVCARLLRAVGRRVDEAVRRDVAAAVEAVAAAAAARERVEDDEDDQRSDGFAHAYGRRSSPLAAIERRTRTASRPRRGDRSATGASRALVEDAERVVTALADQMLGGWLSLIHI